MMWTAAGASFAIALAAGLQGDLRVTPLPQPSIATPELFSLCVQDGIGVEIAGGRTDGEAVDSAMISCARRAPAFSADAVASKLRAPALRYAADARRLSAPRRWDTTSVGDKPRRHFSLIVSAVETGDTVCASLANATGKKTNFVDALRLVAASQVSYKDEFETELMYQTRTKAAIDEITRKLILVSGSPYVYHTFRVAMKGKTLPGQLNYHYNPDTSELSIPYFAKLAIIHHGRTTLLSPLEWFQCQQN